MQADFLFGPFSGRIRSFLWADSLLWIFAGFFMPISSSPNLSASSQTHGTGWKRFLLPAVLALTLAIILVPMPPMVMDLLLSLNLAFSVLLLLMTIFVRKPLDLSVFPTVLLTVVMLRLGLNIATTRLILSRAEEEGTEAAGLVVQAFSEFVTAGNLVVGAILFLIILIIQFIVVTKGAGRISEVSARFTLDALPGKQMAIDAELQSGTISQEEAKRRRMALGDEVDFYGAMDGASKFVRGDAVAGLAITLINILGGLAIGMTQGNHSFAETLDVYTKLTIGDGLVSQIPAFLVAVGAALLVTRSSRDRDLTEDVSGQLFSSPVVLALTGAVLFLLAITPLPKLPLLILGTGCEILAFMLFSDAKKLAEAARRQAKDEEKKRTGEEARKAAEVRTGEAIQSEAIELELGAELVPWTQCEAEFDLLAEIQNIRRTLAREFVFLMPAVRVTSGDGLDGNAYRIRLAGSPAAEQVLRLDSLLAVEGIYAAGPVNGLQTKEPVDHQPAVWIHPELQEEAEALGHDVYAPGKVLVRHLKELALEYAPELLTLDDVQALLDELARSAPMTVRDVVPEMLRVQEIQTVLQRLLAERVPIRNLGQILETLGRTASRTHHPVELTEAVRAALGRLIVSRCVDADGVLHVLTLEPDLEAKLAEVLELTEDGVSAFLSPTAQEWFVKQTAFQAQKIQMLGLHAVLLVSPMVRAGIRELTWRVTPRIQVLSYAEVPRTTRLEQIEMLRMPENGWPD